MIKRLLRFFAPPSPVEPAPFPSLDKMRLFERRAFRLNNRNPDAAAKMVRKLVILSEGRKP